MELQLIQSKVYEIRGQRVMLDFDLAEMYGVETKRLKEQVRRNPERFPDDLMFELKKDEFESLRSQFATSNKRGGVRYMPFAFTEQGVAMLSTVLSSVVPIQININIIRAFVKIRQYLQTNPPVDRIGELQNELLELKEYLEDIFKDQNDINEDTQIQIESINQSLAELHADRNQGNKHRRPIGYIKPEGERNISTQSLKTLEWIA
jgi:hypothetical protein